MKKEILTVIFIFIFVGCTPLGKVIESFTGAVIKEEFSVPVKEGWNFIGLPATYAEIKSTVAVVFFSYDHTANVWKPTQKPFVGGNGYWIDAAKDGTLTFTGPSAVKGIELKKGFNSIGIPSFDVITPSKLLVNQHSFAELLAKKEAALYRWKDKWELTPSLEPGVGYVLTAQREGLLTLVGDADGDKAVDTQDLCPNTPSNEPVGAEGCPKGISVSAAVAAEKKVYDLFDTLGLPLPLVSLSANKVTITLDEGVKLSDLGMPLDQLKKEIVGITRDIALVYVFVDSLEYVHKELGTTTLTGIVSIDNALAFADESLTEDEYLAAFTWRVG